MHPVEIVKELERVADARVCLRSPDDRPGHGANGDPVEFRKGNVSERADELFAPTQFVCVAAAVHRGGDIEKEVDNGVLFVVVHAHEQATKPGVGIPVQAAQIVSRHIRAEVGKLDRGATVWATPGPTAVPARLRRVATRSRSRRRRKTSSSPRPMRCPEYRGPSWLYLLPGDLYLAPGR